MMSSVILSFSNLGEIEVVVLNSTTGDIGHIRPWSLYYHFYPKLR